MTLFISVDGSMWELNTTKMWKSHLSFYLFFSISLSLSSIFNWPQPVMEYKIILPVIFAQDDCLNHI